MENKTDLSYYIHVKKYLFIALFILGLFSSSPFFIGASIGVPAPDFPSKSVLVGTDLYILTGNSSNVTVLDTVTNTVTDTIPTGSFPSEIVISGTSIYTMNGGSDDVTVIDATNNTVTTTVAVGTDPRTMILVGTELYVLNSNSDNITVIDTNSNTVSSTIAVGDAPWYVNQVGTNLYVQSINNDQYSVIDTNTDTVTDTFFHPYIFNLTSATLVGTDLYVNTGNPTTRIQILDTNTNTFTGGLDIGVRPFDSVLVGTDLYIISNGSGVVKVLDTTTDTITDTITVGTNPFGYILVGTDLYISNQGSDNVSVIDTTTNTVVDTIAVEDGPTYFTASGSYLYLSHGSNDTVVLIDTFDNTVIDIGPPLLETGEINGDTLVLTYDEDLSGSSVPSITDFVVDVSGVPVDIESVDIENDTLTLTLESFVLYSDTVAVSYVVPGSNMIEDLFGNDGLAFTDEPVTNNTPNCGLITVGNGPYTSTIVGSNLYINNLNDGTISVLNPSTSLVTDTILGDSATSSVLVGSTLYVLHSASGEVIVMDTTTNSFITTLSTGSAPFYATLVGADLYVNNFNSGQVSVVDTDTNTISDTIVTPGNPYSSVLVGTDLYATNAVGSEVYVIDTNTNTLTDTITVGSSPYFSTLVGTDLYVNNSGEDTISVIDTNTNTVTDTITVGSSPYSSVLVGTDLYVNNSGSSNVSVIDTVTNIIIDTITVGDTPIYSTLAGTNLYVNNFDSNNVSVIDTETNTVTGTISVGANPLTATLLGTNLYVNNSGENTVSVIDTIGEDTFMCGAIHYMLSYSAGAHGSITGDTSQTVLGGSDGTAVTAVPDSGYEFEDWSDSSTENPRTDTDVSGNITVTANFSRTSGGSSSGSNPIVRVIDDIIDDILDPFLPDPILPDPVVPVLISPTGPTIPESPVLPTEEPLLPAEPNEEVPTVPLPPRETNNNTNNNSNFIGDEDSKGFLEYLDTIKVFIESPKGNLISRGLATLGLALGFLVAILSNISGFSDLGLRLLQLWSMFLYGVGLKKRNRPWGVVYDSVTKQPLDPVYVVLVDMKGNEIATSITDMDGRYGFLVEPGLYNIRVNKNNYTYPSLKLAGRTNDELYNDLYFGDVIEIKQRGEVIAKNIPMDQIGFNWNEYIKKEQGKNKFYNQRDLAASRFAGFLSLVGFLTSFAIIFVLPKPYNIIVFCLYLVLFLLKRMKLVRNQKGNVVFEKNDMPLSFGILRVFSASNGMEVAHRVLDKKGNYYLLIANGNYVVSLEKKNEDSSYQRIFTSSRIEIKHGILKKKFRI